MAITNAMIVQNAQFDLMEQGKIGTTGNMLTFRDEAGNEFEMPEPEPIHTFQMWKKLGYHVKRGESAIVKLQIWKYAAPKKTDDTAEVEEDAKMFMKTAFFFSFSQVEKNEPAKPVDPSEFVCKKMSIEIKQKKRKRA
jgi:hypothetical protein